MMIGSLDRNTRVVEPADATLPSFTLFCANENIPPAATVVFVSAVTTALRSGAGGGGVGCAAVTVMVSRL